MNAVTNMAVICHRLSLACWHLEMNRATRNPSVWTTDEIALIKSSLQNLLLGISSETERNKVIMVHTTEISTTISLGNASWRKVKWLEKNLYLTIPWLVSPINLGPTGPGDHSQRPDPPGTAWAVGNRSDITEGTMKNCDMVYNDWDKWYKHVSNILAFYTILSDMEWLLYITTMTIYYESMTGNSKKALLHRGWSVVELGGAFVM